jgi:TAT-translocated FGD2 family F420-dependent dehydrogenase
MSQSASPNGSIFELNRRAILKSAGGIAMSVLGSSVFSGSMQGASAQNSPAHQPTHSIHKGMVGFQLAHEQFRVPELVELGVACEEAGFDLLAFSDHFQPWQANEAHAGLAWVTMSAIGQRTKRIWMGTTVTCPTFRYNPAVVAEAFASLSLLTPGRIFLGIGSGEALNEQAATGTWPKWPERSERLVEATEIIRKMWQGQQVEHSGKYYNVNARLYDPPAKPIPLMMAGNGPKAMRRVGQYADGLITDPKTWKKHKSEFESGAKDAGKDASKMPVFIEQYVVVGDQKDAEVAAKLWRFGPKAWDPYYNVRDPQEIERRANAEVPMEKVTEGWPISTDPDVIDFYGKEVLPRLRKKMAGDSEAA